MHSVPERILARFRWNASVEPCELTPAAFDRYLASLERLCPDPNVGFFGPGSVAWQVNREAALYLGGLRALLMQVAHPAVAEGVLRHSRFVRDPFGRAWNTFVAVQTIIFGTASEAVAVAREVFRRHEPVRGPMPPGAAPELGTHYRASDPELVLWVHATLIEAAVWTWGEFVGDVDAEFCEQLYREGQVFALFFGLTPRRQPPSWDAFAGWFAEELQRPWWFSTDASRRVASALLGALWWARPLGPALSWWAAATLPEPMRRSLGLRWSGGRAAAYKTVGRSIRVILPSLPHWIRYTPFYRRARRRVKAAHGVLQQRRGTEPKPQAVP